MPTVPALSQVAAGSPRHCLIVKVRFATFLRGVPLKASQTGTSSLRSGWRSRWRSTDARTCARADIVAKIDEQIRTLTRCRLLVLHSNRQAATARTAHAQALMSAQLHTCRPASFTVS